MGLDMWLIKLPRVGGLTPRQMMAAGAFWRYERYRGRISFEDYSGYTTDDLPRMFQYRNMAASGIFEDTRTPETDIAYWRNAWPIHRWFVEQVQDGEDDCKTHDEVTIDLLVKLYVLCGNVIEKLGIEHLFRSDFGHNTERLRRTCEELADHGKITEACCDLFPYHREAYGVDFLYHIFYTRRKLDEIVRETDFQNEMIAYMSSW